MQYIVLYFYLFNILNNVKMVRKHMVNSVIGRS